MRSSRRTAGAVVALALAGVLATGAAPAAAQAKGGTAAPATAQAAAPVETRQSVHGKLEAVDVQMNGIVMTTDEGKRVAWQFDKAVVDRLSGFKPGAPVIVIYRQGGAGKMVTAVAFPGSADKPVYVNTSGERVEIVGGPIVDGKCGQPSDSPLSQTTIPRGAQAEVLDACWCCAPAGETCIPANKTGAGQAFLAHCPK